MFTYPDTAIGFIKTYFYYQSYHFHGDTKFSENIIQDLPPKWIIGFLEVVNRQYKWVNSTLMDDEKDFIQY
jgi:hypothetical protein